WDWYGEYPTGGVSDPAGPASGFGRVFRGGYWRDNARGCRSASRDYLIPSYGNYAVGFRVVLAPGQP
ncbi:MAG: formylglycine-generating enzyme family protein, partial [Limisphaerales bacterium]